MCRLVKIVIDILWGIRMLIEEELEESMESIEGLMKKLEEN